MTMLKSQWKNGSKCPMTETSQYHSHNAVCRSYWGSERSGGDENQSEAALRAIDKIGHRVFALPSSPKNSGQTRRRRDRRASRSFVMPANFKIKPKLERLITKGFNAFSGEQDSIQLPDRAEDLPWAASLDQASLVEGFNSMKEMDTDADGRVTWEEFRCVLTFYDVEYRCLVTTVVQVVLCEHDCKS